MCDARTNSITPKNETAHRNVNAFNVCQLYSEALHPPFGVPEGDGNASGYRGCAQRIRPLRLGVRWVCENITDEGHDSTNCRLPSDRIGCPIHLCEEANGNHRANGATNRS